MAGELPIRAMAASKSLNDHSPSHRYVEDSVFPWPEAGIPPFGAMNCCISAGARSDPDVHNQDEIAFIHRGFGAVVIGRDVTPIRRGDVIFIPRNVDHVFDNTDGDGELAFFSVWWPRIEPQS
ncbi:cupin domain-containing protein [Nocardia sp. NPDC048505]|uniref:cupin domain-containing protein n=1 Tax=Nocardia sp. NPDC048505 TaxID=3155756 RepID=UPI0033F5AE51